MLKVIPVDIEIPPGPEEDWRLHAQVAHAALENSDLHGFQDAWNELHKATKKAVQKVVSKTREFIPLHPDTVKFQNELLRQITVFNEEYNNHSAKYEALIQEILLTTNTVLQKYAEKFGDNSRPPSRPPPPPPPPPPGPAYHPIEPSAPPYPAQNPADSSGGYDVIQTGSAKVFRVCQGKNTYYCVRRAT
jgi:hypothetical protein